MKFTHNHEAIIAKHDPKCRARARVELAVAMRLLHDLQAAGYGLEVNDGEEQTLVTDFDKAIETLFSVDEAAICATHGNGLPATFVSLVFGNDGYDLISDYGVSLEPVIAPIYAWAEAAQEAGLCPVFDWEVAARS